MALVSTKNLLSYLSGNSGSHSGGGSSRGGATSGSGGSTSGGGASRTVFTPIQVAPATTTTPKTTVTTTTNTLDSVYDTVTPEQLAQAKANASKPNTVTTQPGVVSTPVDTGSNNNVSDNNTNNSNGVSAYQSYYDSILADQRAAAEARQKALEENYNRQLGVLQNAHNANVESLDSQRDDALRSAYISYMLGQKGLNQQLSNQGMNGGAVESTLAKLLNNYGGNRGSIENQYAQVLGNLNSAYDSNVATLAGQYGNNIADVLADYYNNAASAKQNYANQLMSLAKANASASAKNTTNTASTDSTPSLAQNTIGSNINVGNVSNYNRQNAINDLKYMRGQETDKEALDTVVNTYLNTLMDRYGISEAEAMGILEEANIY